MYMFFFLFINLLIYLSMLLCFLIYIYLYIYISINICNYLSIYLLEYPFRISLTCSVFLRTSLGKQIVKNIEDIKSIHNSKKLLKNFYENSDD